MSNNVIDFVITWVDGNDPKWIEEKNKYSDTKITAANSEVRFRDWENLHFWFRSVEKYAPWVNKIHFVTWGHVPEWLDTTNEKINIVKHEDFIPAEYLPTFSSHTIELNLHRIEGLAEQFVYFNDDMFLTAPTKAEDFFKDGIPLDTAALNCVYFNRDTAGHYHGADLIVINKNFTLKNSFKGNRLKWLNIKNGKKNCIRTFLLSLWHWFPGFYYQHVANGFLKSTFQEVWEKEYDILNDTCLHKFRQLGDVNQWVMKFWQLASGNFIVRKDSFAKCIHISEDNFEELCRIVVEGKYSMICANDTEKTVDFINNKVKLNNAFKIILNEKSSFEK